MSAREASPVRATRDEKIAPTAHYTAYAWHRLGLSHAEHFVTPRGRALYWAFRLGGEWTARLSPRAPLLVDVLAYRHRTIDRELERIAPDRVIELGAGLSRRGLAFAARGVRYLELDLPHMVAAKRMRLARLPEPLRRVARERLRVEPEDVLAPGLGARLARELEGAERAVVIAEGVMGYFAIDERRHIARAVREGLSAAREGSFLCDLRDREQLAEIAGAVRVLRAAIRLVTRGRGLRPDFASAAHVLELFETAGFSGASAVDGSPASSHLHLPIRIWRART